MPVLVDLSEVVVVAVVFSTSVVMPGVVLIGTGVVETYVISVVTWFHCAVEPAVTTLCCYIVYVKLRYFIDTGVDGCVTVVTTGIPSDSHHFCLHGPKVPCRC